MRGADERPTINVDVLLNREDLATSIESILSDDGGAPDALASLFLELKHAIDGGLRGINKASEVLLTGIELAYLHSRAHDAARRLYLLSHEGQLKVEDEPVRLIGGAIERSVGGRRKLEER